MAFTIRPNFGNIPDGIMSFLAGGEVGRNFKEGVEVVQRTYRDSENKKRKGIFACPLNHPHNPKFRLDEKNHYVQRGHQYDLVPSTRHVGPGPDDVEVLWQII